MSHKASPENPNVFAEWGSQHIWGWSLVALLSCAWYRAGNITLCSQILLLPGLLQIPVELVDLPLQALIDLTSGLVFMALVCLNCVWSSWWDEWRSLRAQDWRQTLGH